MNSSISTFIEGQVGPLRLADGSVATRDRRDKTGATVVSSAHGDYAEAVSRGLCFTGSNLLGTPVTTQAGLSATTPALTLHNPPNSGFLANLLAVTIGVNAAPAAATTLCLAVNSNAAAPTSVTNAAIINNLYGAAVNNAVQCYRVATLAAAPLATVFLGSISAASLVAALSWVVDLKGGVGLYPGSQISIQTTTAVALFCSFTWEEIPIL